VAGMPDPPEIAHGGDLACYAPGPDRVLIPERAAFRSAEAYYATLFHELGHATGHPRRLDRPTLRDLCPFGSTNYSQEELVAEMAAAFLAGEAGIAPAVLEASAGYLAGWLRALADDRRLVVVAAAQAQRGADFILARRADAEVETPAAAA